MPWDSFETFPQYLDAIEARGTVLNYGCYVGHTALRLWVMGDDGYEREATDDELRRMQQVIAEAIDGRRGRASRPARRRRTAARAASRCRHASPTCASCARCSNRSSTRRWGVAALLPGETIKHDDVYDLQRVAGRPLTWTALLTIKGYPWHEKIMAANIAARAEGAEVWPQVSCRPLVFQMNLREPFTLNMRDAFKELMDASLEQRIAAYNDPAWRDKAWKELNAGGFGMNWESLKVAESSSHPELVDRSIPEIAQEWGCTPLDAMLDISLSENLETRFWSVLANNDDDGIAWLLPQDTVLLGLADSGAHVSQLCDACFATDLLGNWVRGREVMSLEHAVHKLTGEPAGVYGLRDRGTHRRRAGRRHRGVRPRHGRAGAAAARPRLPRRRRTARRRRARRHAPRPRQRDADPRRRRSRR